MRIVRLNGELGKKYGRVHRLDVRTPGEAIRALCSNHPDFQADLMRSGERGVTYKCVLDKEVIGEDELHYPFSRSFSITPVVAGAGKILKVIAGIALIAVGAVIGSPQLIWLGVATTLSGVAQMLAPTPKVDDVTKKENPYFDGVVNSIAQGSAVPFGYGRMIVGSAVISAAITVEGAPNPMTATDITMMGFSGGLPV